MPYIVPAELPKGCCSCPFGVCSFYYPIWTNKYQHTKGFYCRLDKERRVLEMSLDEDLKAEWCPLREVQKGGAVNANN